MCCRDAMRWAGSLLRNKLKRKLMIEIKRITPETALVFKQVRLRALEESPLAFSSTYAKESQFPDEEWRRRASRCGGDGGDAMCFWHSRARR